MKHLTIRNLPAQVADGLEKAKRQRGQSLNQTVIDLLRQALGIGPEAVPSNGLGALAGGWSGDELDEFEASIAVTEQIDEELWR